MSKSDALKSRGASASRLGPARNALQLKITLRYLSPPVWRRAAVADNITLGNLHTLIQRVMGWGGGHMHEFRLPARGFGPPRRRFGHEGEDEDSTLLSEVLSRKGQVLLYEYDFGDGWLHGIALEQTVPLDPAVRYPVCLAGGPRLSAG